jgi:hypothetical protein
MLGMHTLLLMMVEHCIPADIRSSVHTATEVPFRQENKAFVALGSVEKKA